jgi:hypothetical protein
MIYPVHILVRQEVTTGTPYAFNVEDQLQTKFLQDPVLRFFNPSGTDFELKIEYTIAQSAVFSDTYTAVDQVVAAGAMYPHEFQQPLIQDGLVVHPVTWTNNEATPRYVYCLISGWTDSMTVLDGYIGTPVSP